MVRESERGGPASGGGRHRPLGRSNCYCGEPQRGSSAAGGEGGSGGREQREGAAGPYPANNSPEFAFPGRGAWRQQRIASVFCLALVFFFLLALLPAPTPMPSGWHHQRGENRGGGPADLDLELARASSYEISPPTSHLPPLFSPAASPWAYAAPAAEAYVPARLVAGALGAELTWIPAGKKLVLGYGGEEVTFTAGSREVESSSGLKVLAAPPRLENGQFLLPVEALSLAGVEMATWRDLPHGYALPYPAKWEVDNSLAPVRTVFQAPGLALEVYCQEPEGVTPQTYVGYSTQSVRQEKAGIEFGGERFRRLGDLPVLELEWSRPKLAPRPRDLNYYRQVNVIASAKLVYTFILKATPAEFLRASALLDLMLSRLELFPPQGAAAWPQPQPGREGGGGKELLWPLPEKGLVWGIYQPGAPANPQAVAGLEAAMGKRFGLFLTYQSWGRPFPAVDLEPAYAQGRMVMVTLQSWVPEDGTDTVLTLPILNGDFDTYLRQYARDAARFGRPFFFRFDNEMNGDWDPWCALHYGQDTDLYKEAWRHVYRIFQEEGATNAIFVWNPLDTSYPDFAWNNAHLYYPGDAYVDWVGMTGYNSGDAFSWGRWRSFYEIYAPGYRLYRQLYPDKPLMITEFASHEGGGDKAAWIGNAFWYLEHTFPEIKIAVWWNSVDGPRQYYLDSSPAARQAFVTGMRDEYFVDPSGWAQPGPLGR